MRILLASLTTLALTSCADVTTPHVEGAVRAVSDSDIRAATAAVTRYTGDLRGLFLIQVVDRDEIRFYFGEHYGSQPPYSYQSFVAARRVGRAWHAESVIQGPVNVKGPG